MTTTFESLSNTLDDTIKTDEKLNLATELRNEIKENSAKIIKELDEYIEKVCEDKHYCPSCLCELEEVTYNDRVPYQNGTVDMPSSESICPQCDEKF